MSQNIGSFVFKVKWNSDSFLFYNSVNITQLDFFVKDLPVEILSSWQKINNECVKEISVSEYNEPGVLQGTIYLKKSPTIQEAKQLFEQMGISEFFVKKNRILTKNLITEAEARELALEYELKEFPFTTDCNDTTKINYYDYQLFYASSKLKLMWENNYPKYLYDGYVSKFTELLENAKYRRENFIKNKNQ